MATTVIYRPPELSLRFSHVWRRNLLVWKKLAIASVLGNIADPLLYMLALGYGIGLMVVKLVPVTVHCAACGADGPIESLQSFRCPNCGEPASDIRQGRELEIEAIEIEEAEESVKP